MRYHCTYSSLPAFRPSAKLVPPTMPSADFCTAVRSPYDDLSLVAETQRRSPEVRPTAFAARPPNLPPRSLMTVDFAITCSLVRPGRPRYPVFVHRAAALLHAFFRPHLAMTPLRFANPSPPSGWIEDFHLQAVVHARHTRKPPAGKPAGGPNQPTLIRRSGQEVSLDAEEHAQDVLVVERADRRTRRVRRIHPWALVGRVQVREENVQTDIEVRMRVPLRPRSDLPPAEVRITAVATAARRKSDRREDRTSHRHAADDDAGCTRQVPVDDVGRGSIVVDVDIAAVQRRPPFRVPEVLEGAVDAPHRGQLNRRPGVEHAIRHPARADGAVAVIDPPSALGAGDVTTSTFRVGSLHGEGIALHAEEVVQREAGSHRKA